MSYDVPLRGVVVLACTASGGGVVRNGAVMAEAGKGMRSLGARGHRSVDSELGIDVATAGRSGREFCMAELEVQVYCAEIGKATLVAMQKQ